MKAVLLTEVFTRFRGRRTKVRCSRRFEELYRRVSQSLINKYHSANARQVTTTSPLSDENNGHIDVVALWASWIDMETERRILSGCFIFDVHQAMYHEQSFLKAHLDSTRALLHLPSPSDIWTARTAHEWQAKALHSVPQTLESLQAAFPRVGPMLPPFSTALLIASHASRFPPRDPHNFPNLNIDPPFQIPTSLTSSFPTSPLANAYLALFHTPLHDLLAVAGDTWVFAQKIKTPSSFHAAQHRLRMWSSSLAAARATHHACHVISSTFSQGPGRKEERRLSDYWRLYTASLICWAFGYRCQPKTQAQAPLQVPTPSSNSSTRSSPTPAAAFSSTATSTPYNPHYTTASATQSGSDALAYAKRMLTFTPEELLAAKQASLRGRDNTAAAGFGVVIEAAKGRLAEEAVGSRCMMLVEAVAVLERVAGVRSDAWF